MVRIDTLDTCRESFRWPDRRLTPFLSRPLTFAASRSTEHLCHNRKCARWDNFDATYEIGVLVTVSFHHHPLHYHQLSTYQSPVLAQPISVLTNPSLSYSH